MGWLTAWTIKSPRRYWPKHKRNSLSDHTTVWSWLACFMGSSLPKGNSGAWVSSSLKLHQSQESHLFPTRKREMSVCKPYFFLKSHGPEALYPDMLLLHQKSSSHTHVQEQGGANCLGCQLVRFERYLRQVKHKLQGKGRCTSQEEWHMGQ